LPKVQERGEMNRIEGGKQEAVRVGWKVICSQLSCTSGQVGREGESRGKRQEEMTKENEESMCGRQALQCGCSVPSQA
jgi:hypothetical protein